MTIAVDRSQALARLAELIRSARCAVALTGAGISVPSGIPDFRSPGTGLWENVDPMEVAHIDVFRRDPRRFWHFYGDRFTALRDKRPNGAHAALAALERRGRLAAVVTQNIDALRRRRRGAALRRRGRGARGCPRRALGVGVGRRRAYAGRRGLQLLEGITAEPRRARKRSLCGTNVEAERAGPRRARKRSLCG